MNKQMGILAKTAEIDKEHIKQVEITIFHQVANGFIWLRMINRLIDRHMNDNLFDPITKFNSKTPN